MLQQSNGNIHQNVNDGNLVTNAMLLRIITKWKNVFPYIYIAQMTKI